MFKALVNDTVLCTHIWGSKYFVIDWSTHKTVLHSGSPVSKRSRPVRFRCWVRERTQRLGTKRRKERKEGRHEEVIQLTVTHLHKSCLWTEKNNWEHYTKLLSYHAMQALLMALKWKCEVWWCEYFNRYFNRYYSVVCVFLSPLPHPQYGHFMSIPL